MKKREEFLKNGFTQIPNDLLTNLGKLNLSASEALLVILIERNKDDYLITNTQLSAESGLNRNTVSRCIKNLTEKGYIKSYEKRENIKSSGKIFYLSGLYEKLNSIIKENSMPQNVASDATESSMPQNEDATKSSIPCNKNEHTMPQNVAPDATKLCTNNTKNIKNTTNTKKKEEGFSFSQKKNIKDIQLTVKNQVKEFFNTLENKGCIESIEVYDKTFLSFENYCPTEKEINDILSKGFEPSVFSLLADYWYSAYISSGEYNSPTSLEKPNGGLITPEIRLILKYQPRLDDLRTEYESVLEDERNVAKTKLELETQKEKKALKKPTENKMNELFCEIDEEAKSNIVSFNTGNIITDEIDDTNIDDTDTDDIDEEKLTDFLNDELPENMDYLNEFIL